MKRVKVLSTFASGSQRYDAGGEYELSNVLANAMSERGMVEVVEALEGDDTEASPDIQPIGAQSMMYRCGDCDREFDTQRGLTQHMARAHGGAEPDTEETT